MRPSTSKTAAAMGWLAAVLATACGGPATRSSTDPRTADQAAIVDLSDPSRPLPPEHFLHPDVAQIVPGDYLELRILGFPEMSGTFLVGQDGRFNLSLIGSVQAAGKSTEELDRELTNALSAYYRNLDVAVNINTRSDRFVYVLGQVTRPGRFAFYPGERVIHAVADGGGLTDNSREDSVILLRRDADGKDHVYRLDFSHLFAQLAPQDIYLQPGDVVFVPKSRFKTAIEFASEFIGVLNQTAGTALTVNYLRDRARAITIAP